MKFILPIVIISLVGCGQLKNPFQSSGDGSPEQSDLPEISANNIDKKPERESANSDPAIKNPGEKVSAYDVIDGNGDPVGKFIGYSGNLMKVSLIGGAEVLINGALTTAMPIPDTPVFNEYLIDRPVCIGNSAEQEVLADKAYSGVPIDKPIMAKDGKFFVTTESVPVNLSGPMAADLSGKCNTTSGFFSNQYKVKIFKPEFTYPFKLPITVK